MRGRFSADALVIGAGPAGLGTALGLARRGIDVAVLEMQDRIGSRRRGETIRFDEEMDALLGAGFFEKQTIRKIQKRSYFSHSGSRQVDRTIKNPNHIISWPDFIRAMADVVGASETELVGTDCFAMLHPADRAAARALFMHDLENAGSPEGFHELKEYRFLRKDGTARECQVASAMLRDGDGPILGMAVVTDVTEMRRIKAEAARMGQLATIGELAAGVAHEINSPANAIINCADLLMEDAFDSAMVRDMARRIRSEGQRVAAITHNLLAFARERKPPPPPALVDVKVVLRDTLELTAAQMRAEGILLEVSCSSGALHVLGRTRELQQVFLNIVSNARHALNAIPGSAARCLSINAEPRAAGSCVSGPVVSVSFRDTGGGIDPSIRDRVMEPFFTTKGEGRGTGLGLSISNAIIEDHGGVLRIESDGETGTCVTVELPQMVEDGDA